MNLFHHQDLILAHHESRPNTGDLSDVGTGKTAPCVRWLQARFDQGDVRSALIVCPKTIMDNWQNEINQWSTLTVGLLCGSKEKRLAVLSTAYKVFVINYEGLKTIFGELMMKGFGAIVTDEAHHIKSATAQQTKLMLKLAQLARYRKALTGTVVTNHLEDVWAISQFVDPAIFRMNYWGFRNTYMYNDNAGKPWMNFPKWLPKPGAAEKIQERIAPYFIRFEKREVLKWLPPVLFQKRMVELSDEQRRVYRDLKKDFVAEVEGGELAALHILSRVTKLLEITSGFCYRDDALPYRFKDNAKLKELKNVLEEIGDKRVVIWCSFREDVKIVGGLLDSLEGEWECITGDTPAPDRQFIVNVFNGGSGFNTLICNPECAGEGINLFTEYAIYYSRGWKLGARLQSLGRHDRPGSEIFENVTVIDIIAENSIDQQVMAALENKEDLLKTINPRSFREMA